MDDEKFYDEEIAPTLLELGQKCKERGMPFLAAVQFNSGLPTEGVGKTLLGTVGHFNTDMMLIYLAMKAQGNFDQLALNVSKVFATRSHESVVLSLLAREES